MSDTPMPEGLEALLRRVEEETAALDARLAADAAEMAQWEAERAKAARSGAMGPQWRAVQERIDLGQTTVADVMSGADTTPAATALRDLSRRNLESLREEWLAQDEDPDQPEPSPAALLRGAAADSERHHEELARQIREELRP